ncbi:vesicular-fusion protein sec18 [Pelomyxa schiedti]|nr:vesicular-fusion protein sec18 [Pelomyxa schiedti]
MVVTLKVVGSPSVEHATTNLVYVNPADATAIDTEFVAALADVRREDLPARNFVFIRNFVYSYATVDTVVRGTIALSSFQRQQLQLAMNDSVVVSPYVPRDPAIFASRVALEVDYLAKNPGGVIVADQLRESVMRSLFKQFVSMDQRIVLNFETINLKFRVLGIDAVDSRTLLTIAGAQAAASGAPAKSAAIGEKASCGIVSQTTTIELKKAPNSTLKLSGALSGGGTLELIRPDLNAQALGIGGLDNEFNDIFRRAFVTRLFNPSFIERLGIKHVKGILLYGPPGTGKTLMARQIGKMFNGREPKIVAGPEILNKYVGQSEENVRNLFKEAEDDYKQHGPEADLHVVILDEIDAICRSRGSRNDGTNVGDTVVNQLLAKIDGVEALNNILVIGMTNRLDLIDDALLRPGRLEVKMEIGLPSEEGRLQIFRIHTNQMSSNGYLNPDVDLMGLAKITKNFSGAEIEGLVKSATSFALGEKIDPENVMKPKDPTTVAVMHKHFLAALREVRPAFGVSDNEFEHCMPNGIINYGASFQNIMDMGKIFINQVQAPETRTPLVSLLLQGPIGSGKTAIASRLALESGFAYVKLVSAENLVGYSEMAKCSKIVKVFDDAYKSPLSVIVVDDIERLLEYVPVGPRFSNVVLQHLVVLVKKPPPKGRKLLIIGTTSQPSVLKDMDFFDTWNAVLSVPCIHGPSELRTVLNEVTTLSDTDKARVCTSFGDNGDIPIKKLIHECETAKRVSDSLNVLMKLLRPHSHTTPVDLSLSDTTTTTTTSSSTPKDDGDDM